MAPQVGKEETESFAKNQEILERQGKPHCKKIERNLGTALWTLDTACRDVSHAARPIT